MATAQSPKILRVGIIQNGRIIEERLLRNREPVSIGSKLKNTFVVSSSAVPDEYKLFELKGGNYVLNFKDGMRGRLSLGSQVHDFDSLKSSGKAKKTGSVWTIELDPRSRGKISMGDVTVLYQFVTPPPLRVLPKLPSNMRGGLLLFLGAVIGLNGAFLGSMILSTITHIVTSLYLVYWVPPPPRTSMLDAMDDRLVSILQEEEDDEEEVPEDDDEPDLSEDGDGPAIVAEEDTPAPTENTEQVEENTGPATQEEVQEAYSGRTEDEIRDIARERAAAGSALGAVMQGTDDGAGPALAWVSSTSSLNAADTLSRQIAAGNPSGGGGDGIVTSSGLGTSSGAEGTVDRANIGNGGSGSAVAEAATVTQTEATEAAVEVRANVRAGSSRTAGSGSLSEDNISSVLRRGRSDITRCYERELARDPGLGGRLVVQFSIVEGGRVEDVRLTENSLNSAVGSCVEGRVRRWRFDSPEGGSVAVQVPYILEGG